MGSFKVLRSGLVRGLFLMLILALFTGNVFATAAEEQEMPVITRWINGKALTEDGTFLSDIWAMDGTGMDEKEYVLIGQDSEEVMRVANYPDDIRGGDTAPCEMSSLRLSLSLPEGISGDVLVMLENEMCLYMLTFGPANGYVVEREVYPGVYDIADIEVTSNVLGIYRASDVSEIDATAVGNTVALTIVEGESDASDETSEPTETMGAGGDASEDTGNGWWSSKDEENDLLEDTVKLVICVAVLLLVYAFIKFKREKAEGRR